MDQYIFLSTVDAHTRPTLSYLISESHPLQRDLAFDYGHHKARFGKVSSGGTPAQLHCPPPRPHLLRGVQVYLRRRQRHGGFREGELEFETKEAPNKLSSGLNSQAVGRTGSAVGILRKVLYP